MTDAAIGTARYTIRGKEASDIEFNFGVALEYFGLDYLFQVDYWGGRRLRGGAGTPNRERMADLRAPSEPGPTFEAEGS